MVKNDFMEYYRNVSHPLRVLMELGLKQDLQWKAGEKFSTDGSKYATVDDGWTGLAFIETCIESSQKEGAWVAMPKKI